MLPPLHYPSRQTLNPTCPPTPHPHPHPRACVCSYKDYVDPDFTWANFSVEEQAKVIVAPRSNNLLDTGRARCWGRGAPRFACCCAAPRSTAFLAAAAPRLRLRRSRVAALPRRHRCCFPCCFPCCCRCLLPAALPRVVRALTPLPRSANPCFHPSSSRHQQIQAEFPALLPIRESLIKYVFAPAAADKANVCATVKAMRGR